MDLTVRNEYTGATHELCRDPYIHEVIPDGCGLLVDGSTVSLDFFGQWLTDSGVMCEQSWHEFADWMRAKHSIAKGDPISVESLVDVFHPVGDDLLLLVKELEEDADADAWRDFPVKPPKEDRAQSAKNRLKRAGLKPRDEARPVFN